MLSFLHYTQKKGFCAIELSNDGFAFAYTPNQSQPEVTICKFFPTQNNQEVKDSLSSLIKLNRLSGINCNWVLHPDNYRLMLVNAPSVPPAEYKTAVKWQIKDIINYPLDDVAVDIFLPAESIQEIRKIYVIAAQNSYLQKTVNLLQDCELRPVAIDIREFSIRNLLTGIEPEKESIGFLNIANDSTLIVIIKNQRVYFARRIPIGLKSIKSNNITDLIAELQRSFGYCDSELKLAIPSKFYLPPTTEIDNPFAQNIAQSLSKEVAIIDIKSTASITAPLTPTLEERCWSVVGGVLRKEGEK